MPDPLERLSSALKDHYRIERELGRGGMATVYLAHDLRHDRAVAVKVLHPELAETLGAERFHREIRISARLQHPNVLTLIDSGEAGGLFYYVMPFVEGESLRERLEHERPLPIDEAHRYIRDVIDALSYAHGQNVVHRDVKPANVLISGRHALVTDFGVAKAVRAARAGPDLTTAGISLGTPTYMAPEQAAGDPDVDHRADLYALGVMAYEILAGRPPFEGPTAQAIMAAHLTSTPEPLSTARPDVPERLAGAVMRCLEKDPDARWQSADELLAEWERARVSPQGSDEGAKPKATGVRRRRLLTAVAAAALVAVSVGWLVGREGRARTRWAKTEALPQIERLAEDGEWDAAYTLAREAARVIPDDEALERLWPRFSFPVTIVSTPSGADVYRRNYGADAESWEHLGATPLDSFRMPRGVSQLRYERTGYRPVHIVATWWMMGDTIRLDSAGVLPEEMVRIPGGELRMWSPMLDHLPPIALPDFLIDAYEVSNEEFQRFVDAGGYQNREYWQHEIVIDRRVVPWAQAVARFTDRTGRPGPSTWEGGAHPSSRARHPVGGVSWYEAAAYARFVGKELPTVYHWNRAADIRLSGWVTPRSNIGRDSVAPVGQYNGVSRFGVLDMAGNVREWCFNADRNERYILGGAASDPHYAFNDAYSQPPIDRSAINGIRLVTYLDTAGLERARRSVDQPRRDFLAEQPVSDQVFAVFRRLYDYDALPLEERVEAVDSQTQDWVHERVSFNAAYGGERVVVHLFLPRQRKPPYQSVVYFPGSNTIGAPANAPTGPGNIDFVVKSGRAAVFPIYKSTYERRDSLRSFMPDESDFYRQHVIWWAKDLRRSIDYLATRSDIDLERLAYFGVSWGGRLGPIMLGVEPRLKTGVLYIAGLRVQRKLPEVDPFNFLPRVTVPVIMINGRYDPYFPVETSQTPMFLLLGSPPEHKRHFVEDGGHFVARTHLVRETLDWLDRYLGPVQ